MKLKSPTIHFVLTLLQIHYFFFNFYFLDFYFEKCEIRTFNDQVAVMFFFCVSRSLTVKCNKKKCEKPKLLPE